MQEKRWLLIEVIGRDIRKPEFFDTYEEAHKAMKEYYEIASANGVGELNDCDAWCNMEYYNGDWKIFYIT